MEPTEKNCREKLKDFHKLPSDAMELVVVSILELIKEAIYQGYPAILGLGWIFIVIRVCRNSCDQTFFFFFFLFFFSADYCNFYVHYVTQLL